MGESQSESDLGFIEVNLVGNSVFVAVWGRLVNYATGKMDESLQTNLSPVRVCIRKSGKSVSR